MIDECLARIAQPVLFMDVDNRRINADMPRYLLDSSKIQQELGWIPQIPFEQGFRETVAWYQHNPAWWQPLLKRLAIQEDAW